MVRIDGRDQLADFSNKVRLQPALFVSTGERMAAAETPRLVDFTHDTLQRQPERIGCAFLGNSRDLDATQSHGNRITRNMRHRLQKVRSDCADALNFRVDTKIDECLYMRLRRQSRKLQR